MIAYIGMALLLLGGVLMLIGVIGLYRFPDLFSRLHVTSVVDSLGIISILIGLIFISGINLVSIKLFLILVFFIITAPVTTHALAQAALRGKLKPYIHKEQ